MTHPLDRLAPLTDGALAPTERADVEAHLRSCTRCRIEVAAARGARQTMRAMPAPEAPDLALMFSPERISELAGPPTGRRPSWSKVAPVLAAAAVVALVALALPRLGDSSDVATTAADGVAEPGEAAGALRLEIVDTDHDEASLQTVAGAFVAARSAEAAGAVDQGAGAGATATAPRPARFAGPARTAKAVACLEQAFPAFPGEIVRVQQATFRGTLAYLGFVLENPGAGTPPDTLSIWVAAVDDCSILTLVSARL